MAQDAFIDQKINEFQQAIRDAVAAESPLALHRQLRLFAKEVERETRHAAVEILTRASNAIQNL